MDAQISQLGRENKHALRAIELADELVQLETPNESWPGASRKILRLAERFGAESALAQLALHETLDRLFVVAREHDKSLNGLVASAVVNGYHQALTTAEQGVAQGRPGALSDHVIRLAALRRINQAATASLDLEA